MTVIISGSAGIQNPLGSAAAPSESNTTNSNTGAYFPTGTTYGIATNGSNAMYIDASQNVGIGTTSPGAKLNVVTSGGKSTVAIGDTATNTYSQVLMYGGATHYNWSIGAQYNVTDALEITPSTAVGGTTFSTPALVINSSGNVGIGGAPIAGGKLDVFGAGVQRFYMRETGSTVYGKLAVNTSNFQVGTETNHALIFNTNDSERARIDTSGNLLVGVTTSVNGGSAFTSAGTVMSAITAATTNTNMIVFRNGNGNVGSITTNGSATAFNTSSDYRLKENVQPMQNALATVGALKPVTYDWINDKSAGEGFIAHELQVVIPLAVTGEKDAVDDEGNIKAQGVDYSKIVVHLVAAIQELTAEVTALKAKVGA